MNNTTYRERGCCDFCCGDVCWWVGVGTHAENCRTEVSVGTNSNQEEVLVRRTEQWNRVLSTWCLYFYFCWCCFLEKWCCLVCLLHGVKGLVPLSFGTSMFWRNIPRQCKHCISIKRKQEKTSLLFQTLNESSSYMRWQIRNIKKKKIKRIKSELHFKGWHELCGALVH